MPKGMPRDQRIYPRTEGIRGDAGGSHCTSVVNLGIGWSVVEERILVAEGTRLEEEGS